MRGLLPTLAAFTFLGAFSTSWADDAADRSAAIRLCRAEAAARAGVSESEVRLDTLRTRARAIRVDLDVWIDGDLVNVRCDVQRGAELAIAAINLPEPATQTAAQ